ncbi:MAG TPA: hypothetical protein PKN33_11585 [Phycisphaerae bacterium]|nr:hypothetical protein [Phycisphaerales bacterium]HNO78692.1 hypothetical protein [Phycisphaerae bacterium]
MIRKALILVTSLAAISIGALAVMSFSCRSEFDCLDLADCVPMICTGTDSSTGESYVIEPHMYPEDYCVVEDAGAALWWKVTRSGLSAPSLPGVTMHHQEYAKGRRAYVYASRGECLWVQFTIRNPAGPAPVQSKKNFIAFSIERDGTDSRIYLSSYIDPQMCVDEYKSLCDAVATVDIVRVQLWLPFILFAAYPLTVLVTGIYRRRIRRKRNQCLKCAYDLTGNTSGICPECGDSV